MTRAFALPQATALATPAAAACACAEGRPRPLLFLDIEASSLAPHSWPVEVGWAWIEGGLVESRSVVVAPRPSWCDSAWSEEAEAIHGLSRARLESGRAADAVAALTDAFADRHVVSDNPSWDQLWLDRLREGRARIAVHPVAALVRAGLDAAAANAFTLALLRSPAPHRAAGDAGRLARAWAAATRVQPRGARVAAGAGLA